MNKEKEAQNKILLYRNRLLEDKVIVSEIRKNPYSYEFDAKLNNDSLKFLLYFGKKGLKPVIQGNTGSSLYKKVSSLFMEDTLFSRDENPTENSSITINEPESYIGTDESGKGDYFGPLVIAGFYSDPETSSYLKKIGVKDSKLLSDEAIKIIAGKIKSLEKNYSIILISPGKYNELYEKFKNLNRLLGWAHAKVIENILEQNPDAAGQIEAIADKFGDEKHIIHSLQEKGKNIILHQYTKAERFPAVAAASILARNRFNEWFEIQKREFKLSLPKGASLRVIETASELKKKLGEEAMKNLVKLHFKTTKAY